MQTPAIAQVEIRVIETDPPSPSTLGHWEPFHLRIGYETDRAVRIYVGAFLGARRLPSMTSASPSYEAGAGEAEVWVAFTDPARVDRIVVRAHADGKDLARAEVPVSLTWTGITPPVPRRPADWVGRLQDHAQRHISDEYAAYRNRPGSWLAQGLVLLLPWATPGYLVLQIVLLRRYRGSWRLASAVPAVPMAGVLIYTILAMAAGSNVFPLVWLLASFFACVSLLGLMALHRLVEGAS